MDSDQFHVHGLASLTEDVVFDPEEYARVSTRGQIECGWFWKYVGTRGELSVKGDEDMNTQTEQVLETAPATGQICGWGSWLTLENEKKSPPGSGGFALVHGVGGIKANGWPTRRKTKRHSSEKKYFEQITGNLI